MEMSSNALFEAFFWIYPHRASESSVKMLAMRYAMLYDALNHATIVLIELSNFEGDVALP